MKLGNKKFKLILKFLIRFNLLAIPLYVILMLDVDFIFLQNSFASILQFVFMYLGYNVSKEGFFLYFFSDGSVLPIDISRDCIGWKGAYCLTALLIATPMGKLKDKIKFLIIWVPILVIINFFRVFITILAGIHYNVEFMMVIHNFLWQFVLILIIISIWYTWLKKNRNQIKTR